MIKTGFCVSYDWVFLKKSLPRVYDHSDIICLSVDKNRKSWKGEAYDFNNEDFFAFIKKIDVDNKIDVYEDDFSLPDLNSRENCNRQRTLIAERMGKGGWHVQIDSDEYFLDFAGLVDFMKSINSNPTGDEKGVNVLANWISLIKKTSKGYLHVSFDEKLPESFPVATNRPDYKRARHNDYFNYLSPFYALHETWARSEDELWFKINNWGHSAEELEAKQDRLSYYELWKSLDERNYSYIYNFHPAQSTVWPCLKYLEATDVDELLKKFSKPQFPLSNFKLKVFNTKIHARLRQMGWLKF